MKKLLGLFLTLALVGCGGGGSGGGGGGGVTRPEPTVVFGDDAGALAITQFVVGSGSLAIELGASLSFLLGDVYAPVAATDAGTGDVNLAKVITQVASSVYRRGATGDNIASPAVIIDEAFFCSPGSADVFVDILDPFAEVPSAGDVIEIDFNACTDLSIEGIVLFGTYDGLLRITFRDFVENETLFLVSIEVEAGDFQGNDGFSEISVDGSFVITERDAFSASEDSILLEFSAPQLNLSDSELGTIRYRDYEYVIDDDFNAEDTLITLAGCLDSSDIAGGFVCFDTIPELLWDFISGFFEAGELFIEGDTNSYISIISNGSDFPDVEIDFDGDGQSDSTPGWSWFEDILIFF